MEFFNKKEEVLEVTLTQKGKELFAQGMFRPYYYSFHDNDIAYDNSTNELQNEIVPRIKETPTLKQNTSVYQNSKNIIGSIKSEQTLYSEIGSKTLGDQYRPSWNLNFIKSPSFQYVGTNPSNPTDNKKFQVKFSSSVDLYNENQEVIPQIDIKTNYGIYAVLDSKTNDINYYFVKDYPTILNLYEYNSFENYEKQEFEVDSFYIENGKSKDLTFNKDMVDNIFQYLNILFDNEATFDININTKDIYGNLVEKDESNC